jgi:hypothetical protein
LAGKCTCVGDECGDRLRHTALGLGLGVKGSGLGVSYPWP